MSNYGFKIDDFPGNMTVVLAKIDKATLLESQLCPVDYSLNDEQAEWIVISPKANYDPHIFSELAQKISNELSCMTLRYQFGDASGHMELNRYEKGKRIEGYSFGPDYSEEMAEYGGLVREAKVGETLIQDGETEWVYYSTSLTREKPEVMKGVVFLNQLFVEQKALLSWDYLPQ